MRSTARCLVMHMIGQSRVCGLLLFMAVNPQLLAASPIPSFDERTAVPHVNDGSHAYGHYVMVESVFGAHAPMRVGTLELLNDRLNSPLPGFNQRHDAKTIRVGSTSLDQWKIGQLIRYLAARPDKERFSGLIQVLDLVRRFGEPGHVGRVRALPVSAQRNTVIEVGGRWGVVKRYVHSTGATRDVFLPLGAHPVGASNETAPDSEPADSESSEPISTDVVATGLQDSDWCEMYDEELGDLSGECATEQDFDDYFAVLLSFEVELASLDDLVTEQIDLICSEQTSGPVSDGTGSDLDYTDDDASELCGTPTLPEPLPEPSTYAEEAPGDFGLGDSTDAAIYESALSEYQYRMEPTCNDSNASLTVGCVDEAAAAVLGVGLAILGVSEAADVGVTGWLSKWSRVSARALITKSAIVGVGVGLAAYGVYSFVDCVQN